MIEKIKEKNVWDYLKETSLPIALYGMGNGTDMVIEKLDEIGVKAAEVFASVKCAVCGRGKGSMPLENSLLCIDGAGNLEGAGSSVSEGL